MLTLRSVARRQTCGVDGGRDQSTVTVYSLPYCTRQEARLDQTPTEREREIINIQYCCAKQMLQTASSKAKRLSKEAGDKSTNYRHGDCVARQLVEFLVLSWHHVRHQVTNHELVTRGWYQQMTIYKHSLTSWSVMIYLASRDHEFHLLNE